jgi:Flp pilus assembly protein TadG
LLRTRSRAQSLVELAFVLPVLLLILLGMIDLGRAFVFGVAVQNGAREAARLGSRAAIDSSVTDTAVRARLIAASAPALAGCLSTTSSSQSCSVGTWTLGLSIVGTDGVTYSSLSAVPSTALSGAKLTVTAQGSSLSMVAGMVTGMGLRLSAISAQGQAVMMVL